MHPIVIASAHRAAPFSRPLLLAAAAASGWGAQLYVDAAAAGAGTGSSWTNAYPALATALAAAGAGDEIWIARGTYLPGGAARTASFAVPAGVAVIGGFHSPMEQECLALLLKGRQPIVICPARGIDEMRLAIAWREAISAGRLLVISPFEPKDR
ncbi:MAG: hypothetical protein H0W83_02155, partial [Planctomycetes bacterium]|nr:hypothetical protein [Planctomycetota bacterium]